MKSKKNLGQNPKNSHINLPWTHDLRANGSSETNLKSQKFGTTQIQIIKSQNSSNPKKCGQLKSKRILGLNPKKTFGRTQIPKSSGIKSQKIETNPKKFVGNSNPKNSGIKSKKEIPKQLKSQKTFGTTQIQKNSGIKSQKSSETNPKKFGTEI